MLEPVEPPRNQKKQSVGTWTYCGIPNGTSTVGFLAGYPTCCATHHSGNTKPCRAVMSKHLLSCPFCETGREVEYRAYVPFYSQQYISLFVLVPYEYVESVREIGLHAQIKISRHKNPKSPCVIREEVWTPKKLPITPEREPAVNLMNFLVMRLWKDAELKKYALSAPTSPAVKAVAVSADLPDVVESPPAVVPPFNLKAAVIDEMLRQNGHHSRVVPDKDGNLVPLAESLPALGSYNKRNKPRG